MSFSGPRMIASRHPTNAVFSVVRVRRRFLSAGNCFAARWPASRRERPPRIKHSTPQELSNPRGAQAGDYPEKVVSPPYSHQLRESREGEEQAPSGRRERRGVGGLPQSASPLVLMSVDRGEADSNAAAR